MLGTGTHTRDRKKKQLKHTHELTNEQKKRREPNIEMYQSSFKES